MVTTGVSGLARWRYDNVDFGLFRQLALPGMVGTAAGAYVLTTISAEHIQPWIGAYLLLMGGVIFWKALRASAAHHRKIRSYAPLGLIGGFLDAVGGGGWGRSSPRPWSALAPKQVMRSALAMPLNSS